MRQKYNLPSVEFIEGYTGKYLSEDVFLAAGKRLLTERKLKREEKQNIIFVIYTTLQINIYIYIYTCVNQ